MEVCDTENMKNKQYYQQFSINVATHKHTVKPSPTMVICRESFIIVYNLCILYLHSFIYFCVLPLSEHTGPNKDNQHQSIQQMFSGSALQKTQVAWMIR